MKLPIALGPALLFVSISVNAAVNLWNGSYSHAWRDIDAATAAARVTVTRTYNSRSLQDGIFGFGWCAKFEIALRSRALKTRAVFDECGSSLTQAKNRVRVLRDELGRIREFIAASPADSEAAEFTLLKIEYAGSSRHLRSLTALGHRATYALQADDLKSVTDATTGKVIFYSYDLLHNLTRIQFPDLTTERIDYDPQRDLVIAVDDREGCSEHYRFFFDQPAASVAKTALGPGARSGHFASQAGRTCAGRPAGFISQDFWHETTADGQIYLSRTRIRSPGHRERDIRFSNAAKILTQTKESRNVMD